MWSQTLLNHKKWGRTQILPIRQEVQKEIVQWGRGIRGNQKKTWGDGFGTLRRGSAADQGRDWDTEAAETDEIKEGERGFDSRGENNLWCTLNSLNLYYMSIMIDEDFSSDVDDFLNQKTARQEVDKPRKSLIEVIWRSSLLRKIFKSGGWIIW